jgi:hypothetical protein
MNIKNENRPVGGDEGDNASGSGGPGWPDACRREETIRKLLGRSEGERLKMGDVEDVALELGVSRAMLYRLITAYRQSQPLSCRFICALGFSLVWPLPQKER